jgi:DNA repair exonuclease SbcCD ATPase subunit
MPATSLESLQQQIRQREQELQQLRQEFKSRRDHLSELTRRKEELESQLLQVEEEIAALSTTSQPPKQATRAVPSRPVAAIRTKVPASNSSRKEKSKSNLQAPARRQKVASGLAKPKPVAKKSREQGTPTAEAAKTATSRRRGGQPSLRELVTNILKVSRKPVSARELAEQILASGYHSDSKKFVKVVSIMLWKIDNVEHVPDQGYRLKKK